MTDLNTEPMRKARQAILALFDKEPYLTFGDLEKAASPFLEIEGNIAFAPGQMPTLIGWIGMSQGFIDLIDDMIKARELFPNLCSPYWYGGEDGICLPLAVLGGDKVYTEPHWVPIIFGQDETTPEEAIEIIEKSEIMQKAVDEGVDVVVVEE